ncbi:MAG: hypothetical protein AAF721_14195 [Myxococcota bacterium]
MKRPISWTEDLILCDGKGHPLHFELSAGQTHDSTMLDALLVGADESLHDEHGQSRPWPVALAKLAFIRRYFRLSAA